VNLYNVGDAKARVIDYEAIYREWPGRLHRDDCRRYCKGPHRCCPPGQTLLLLPGEGAFLRRCGVPAHEDTYVCPGVGHCLGALRPICCRTYPLAPDAQGNLFADTACSQHRWASWHFLTDAARLWRLLLTYPQVREWVATMRRDHYSQRAEVAVDAIDRSFDAGYAETFAQYHQGKRPGQLYEAGLIARGDTVLVVGCGDGKSVAELRAWGVFAYGVDVNADLVTKSLAPDCVRLGDVRQLPCQDHWFDMVVCVDVLEHIPDYDKALAEMARVSRGRVYVEVTTLEQPADLFEDPTHCVFLTSAEWQAAIVRHMPIEGPVVVGPDREGWCCKVGDDGPAADRDCDGYGPGDGPASVADASQPSLSDGGMVAQA
jgi:SAM-dependent methyltransferase